MLVGQGEVVREIVEARNAAFLATISFELAPEDVCAVMDRLGVDEDVVAVWHSHPVGPPVPSSVDREQLVEGVSVIVSPASGVVRAWWMAGGMLVEPVELRIKS